MSAGLHHASASEAGRESIWSNMDDVLELWVVQKEARRGIRRSRCWQDGSSPLDRTIPSHRESCLKSVDVQALHPSFALENASMKHDHAIFFKEFDNLVVVALVDVVSIGMLEITDGINIFKDSDASILLADKFLELFDFRLGHGETEWNESVQLACAGRGNK